MKGPSLINPGYDPLVRFHSVSSFVFSALSVAHYSYLPDSDLISGWSNGILQIVRSFEPNRDPDSTKDMQTQIRFGHIIRNRCMLYVMVGCLFLVTIIYSVLRNAYVVTSSSVPPCPEFEVWFRGLPNVGYQIRCSNVVLDDGVLYEILAKRHDRSRIGPLVIRVESGVSARAVFPLIEMAESYGYSNITIRINETYPDETQLMRMYGEPRKTLLVRVWECAENRLCNGVDTLLTIFEEMMYGSVYYYPSPKP